ALQTRPGEGAPGCERDGSSARRAPRCFSMREYTTAATELAGLGVADVPLLLPRVGLEGQLPVPRARDHDRVPIAPVTMRMLLIDVLPARRPRYRRILALERNP